MTTADGASHRTCCCRPRRQSLSSWQTTSRSCWRRTRTTVNAGQRLASPKRDESGLSNDGGLSSAFERHYRMKELAGLWGLSTTPVTTILGDVPGVMRLANVGPGKHRYTTFASRRVSSRALTRDLANSRSRQHSLEATLFASSVWEILTLLCPRGLEGNQARRTSIVLRVNPIGVRAEECRRSRTIFNGTAGGSSKGTGGASAPVIQSRRARLGESACFSTVSKPI
jgi:hypothetical protein